MTRHETLIRLHGEAAVALADELRTAAKRALGAENVASLSSDGHGLHFTVALPGGPGDVRRVIVTAA